MTFSDDDRHWFDEGDMMDGEMLNIKGQVVEGRSAGCYEREIRELRLQVSKLENAAQYAQLWILQIDGATTEDEAIDRAFGPAKATALRQLAEALP